MRSSIIPLCLTILLTLFPAVFAYNPKPYNPKPKPSSTPKRPGWYCPETDKHSRSKIEEYCDKPPYKGILFGCTYDDGKGGNYVCTFDSKSGECTGGGEHCPEAANWYSESHFKRAPVPKPTPTPVPVPDPTPTPIMHRAARNLVAVKV